MSKHERIARAMQRGKYSMREIANEIGASTFSVQDYMTSNSDVNLARMRMKNKLDSIKRQSVLNAIDSACEQLGISKRAACEALGYSYSSYQHAERKER